MSRNRLAVLGATLLLGAVACSDSNGPGSGTVGLRLTNASVAAAVAADVMTAEGEAPLPADMVKSVDIFVVRIDARRGESTEQEAAENTEEAASEASGWVTIAEPNALMDLMTLADGSIASLGEAEVTAGDYRSFRLVIDPAQSSLTLNDEASTVIGGESIIGLKFPSAAKTGIKINLTGGAVDVEADEETTVLVTFDVSKSFVMRGATIEQNGLLFKPVIKAQQTQ